MSVSSDAFLSAIMLGLFVAAPIGPVGLLCITRSLENGLKCGLSTGLGAASIHACWALLGTVGMQPITTLLDSAGATGLLSWLTAVLLMFLGYRAMMSRRSLPAEGQPRRRATRLASYGSGAALAVGNPVTAALFMAAIPSFSLAPLEGNVARLAWAAGTFAGSAGWWLLLSASVAACRVQISGNCIVHINRATGGVLMLFGTGVLIRGV
jgi:threonine/homoserine/homoserine lactone efflux protein